MTISTEPTRLSYDGDDVTDEFPISWNYFSKEHVNVVLRDSAGSETTWVLDTDYTLTDADLGSGTLTATTAPATGETLIIDPDPPNTQEESLPIGGSIPIAQIENALDLAAQRDAKIEGLFNRGLRVPVSDSQVGGSLELPIDSVRAGKALYFDSNGVPVATVPDGSIIYAGASAPDENDFQLWYDTANNNFKYWDSSSWQIPTSTDITGKADKVVGGTTGALLEQDASGNLADTGVTIADLATDAELAAEVSALNTALAGKSDTGHTHDASGIDANAVGADELNVSGNGTTSQYLRSDGDGTFTWATPPDTDTHASTDFGGIGSYTWTLTTGSTVAIGATAAASSLTNCSSGTWRNMHNASITSGNAGLMVRIS